MAKLMLEELVANAVDGDTTALDGVIRAIKDDIYGLAIRMLWHPADAEDATQEILLRVVTAMSGFEGRSSFRSWVYRVAVRALLNVKRGRAEAHTLSFDEFGDDLLSGLDVGASAHMPEAEHSLLKREVKIACTQAMLLCLDRDHRMAYLLGEILELDGAEASNCLDVSGATYRKRLSRARQRVNDFAASRCGLVSETAPCSCAGRIAPAIQLKRIDAGALLFASHPITEVHATEVKAVVEAIGDVCDGTTLMRSNPLYAAPESVLAQFASLTTAPRN